MKIAGIIAEYNPFHNGHLYQVEKTRQSGATHIVAVMSGSFVQRGESAILSKWRRAEAALLNGVDLVIELPVEYSLSSANHFAYAGVFLLNELMVDMISFGSECGDIPLLKKTAEHSIYAENSEKMQEYLSSGMSYPRAREAALTALYGNEYGKIIAEPNNLLGIEYIKAINAVNPSIEVCTIARTGAAHDAQIENKGSIASASYVRACIARGDYSALGRLVPLDAYKLYIAEIESKTAPILESRLETAILYKLRTMTREDFAALKDVNEGLENRLFRASRETTSLDEFLTITKTKRYTLARLRRIVYNALLGISKGECEKPPQYLRILGMNKRGMEIIANAKKSTRLIITPKFADLYKANPKGVEFMIKATDIANLGAEKINPTGMDFTENTVIL